MSSSSEPLVKKTESPQGHSRAARRLPGRVATLLQVLCLSGLLAACGFEPLYGDRSDGPNVADELGKTYLLPIADRQGQVLYNYLRDRIVPRGQPERPKYVLSVILVESVSGAVVRRDATASRNNLTLTATYTLQDAASKQVLTRGQAQAVGSYNVRTDPYPTLVAELDVRTRVARDLSDEIRNRLAVYMLDPTVPPPPRITRPEAPEPILPSTSAPELERYTR
jgi:LPS-assembly lipoprotein